MVVIFEGTFAELQQRVATIQLPPLEKVRLEINSQSTTATSMMLNQPWVTGEYMRNLEEIVDAADEEEARDAYRIAGY